MSPNKYFIASKIRAFRRELEFLFGSTPFAYKLNSLESEIYNICKGEYSKQSKDAGIGLIDTIKWAVYVHKNPFNRLGDYESIEDKQVLSHVIGTLTSAMGGEPMPIKDNTDLIERAVDSTTERNLHPSESEGHNYIIRNFIIEYCELIRKLKTKKRNKYKNEWYSILSFNPPLMIRDFEMYFEIKQKNG